jgi:hypothetical protein
MGVRNSQGRITDSYASALFGLTGSQVPQGCFN